MCSLTQWTANFSRRRFPYTPFDRSLRDSVTGFLTIFVWLKRFDLGSRQNGFANFFVFAKIFDRKYRKSFFFYRSGGFHIFKLLLLDV